MDLLSIVVPAYNAEKYLDGMVNCLLRQTYPNKEIILVDDGSRDGTPARCNSYAQAHDCIRVVHKQNEGVYSARNAGMDAARGSYIAFVDADDCIDDRAFDAMIKALVETDSDVVACGFQKEYSPNFEINVWRGDFPKPYVYEGSSAALLGIGAHEHDLAGFIWNKVFRREAIGDIRFRADAPICDDMVFVYEVMRQVRRAVYIDVPFYHYRYVASSLSKDGSISKFMKCLEAMGRMLCWCEKDGPEGSAEAMAETYLFWNTKTCEQMLKRFDPESFRQIQKNIATCTAYLPCCSFRVRVLCKAILKSWNLYRPLGTIVWYMKRAYLLAWRIRARI